MKSIVLFLVIVVLSNPVSAQADSSSCKIYHRGFFSYTDTLGNTVIVQRKNKYQYERNTVTKVKTQFRITWTGDCTYEIFQTLTNSKAARKYKYSTTKLIISKTDGNNGYEYSCACADPAKGKGYMKLISKKAFFDLY
ncbi:hypothetical protein [Ferruginibacter profundus]